MLGLVFDVMVKIVSLFLIGMLVLAMFGRLKMPGRKMLKAKKCPSCGTFLIGKGPCSCKSKKD